jgi:hypothetical protein
MPIRNFFKRSSTVEPLSTGVPERGFSSAIVIGATPDNADEPIEFQLSGMCRAAVDGALDLILTVE